ncbi:MAG: hypothetical protein FWF59_08140 [Turicibacter sp.]|nr:hypothetical protein [Turicibacter sp.]
MNRVSQINYSKAPETVQKEHDFHIENVGKMTNMKRTLLNNIPTFRVMMEWYTMKDEAKKFLNDLEIYFLCYTISSENECAICSLFFVKLLQEQGIDHRNFEFNARQQALVDYGRAIGKNPKSISDEVFAALKKEFTEEQIVVITGFAAMMVATNLINHVLEVDVDGEYEGMDWK